MSVVKSPTVEEALKAVRQDPRYQEMDEDTRQSVEECIREKREKLDRSYWSKGETELFWRDYLKLNVPRILDDMLDEQKVTADAVARWDEEDRQAALAGKGQGPLDHATRGSNGKRER
jgi:hypothetical protein